MDSIVSLCAVVFHDLCISTLVRMPCKLCKSLIFDNFLTCKLFHAGFVQIRAADVGTNEGSYNKLKVSIHYNK